MSYPFLVIAGIRLPYESYPASQSYAPLEDGSILHRTLNGTGIKQTHFSKLVTTIEGDGFTPAPLDGVDWSAAVSISCIKPMVLNSASNVATLPAARRSDLTDNVLARALVDGYEVATPVNVVGNTATATVVAGASAYRFWYFPVLSCFSRGPQRSLGIENAAWRWSLTAEEV